MGLIAQQINVDVIKLNLSPLDFFPMNTHSPSYNSTKGKSGPLQSCHIKFPNVSLKTGEAEGEAYFQTPGFWHHPEGGEASIHQAHLCFQLHITTPGSSLYLPLLTSPDTIYCGFITSSISWLTLLFVRSYSPIPSTSYPLWIKLVLILQRTLLWSKTSPASFWEVTIHSL